MKKMKILAVLVICLLLTLAVAGCVSSTSTPTATPTAAVTQTAQTTVPTQDTAASQTEVKVFAAASLTGAMNEMISQFEKANPSIKVVGNYAGSQALKTQILEGADCDVYISANDKQFDPVVDAGLIQNKKVLLQNKLGIVVAKDNPKNIATLDDLLNVKLVIGNKDVPFGQYTRDIINKYQNDSHAGFVDKFMDKVETEVDAVTNVKSYITLGEADASIVYISDISKDDKKSVAIIELPDKYNVIANYPYGVLKASENKEAVQKFVDFMTGKEGSAILTEYGFTPVTA